MDWRSVWKAIRSGLMRSRWEVPKCRKWPSQMSVSCSTKADAPTRCASSSTCAPLVLGDTPHMPCPRKVDRVPVASLPGNPSGSLSQSDEPPRLGETHPCMFIHDRYPVHCESERRGGRGQWLGCTTPPRLAGCDHTFIAVPQAAHSLSTHPGVVYAHGGSAD